MTRYEIFKNLLWPGQVKDSEVENRLQALTEVVFDLLAEVEALRELTIRNQGGQTAGKESAYGRAYEDTAVLMHDSGGPTSGMQKLIERFYPEFEETVRPGWAEKRAWRECLMMQRLGFTEAQIAEYKRTALQVEHQP